MELTIYKLIMNKEKALKHIRAKTPVRPYSDDENLRRAYATLLGNFPRLPGDKKSLLNINKLHSAALQRAGHHVSFPPIPEERRSPSVVRAAMPSARESMMLFPRQPADPERPLTAASVDRQAGTPKKLTPLVNAERLAELRPRSSVREPRPHRDLFGLNDVSLRGSALLRSVDSVLTDTKHKQGDTAAGDVTAPAEPPVSQSLSIDRLPSRNDRLRPHIRHNYRDDMKERSAQVSQSGVLRISSAKKAGSYYPSPDILTKPPPTPGQSKDEVKVTSHTPAEDLPCENGVNFSEEEDEVTIPRPAMMLNNRWTEGRIQTAKSEKKVTFVDENSPAPVSGYAVHVGPHGEPVYKSSLKKHHDRPVSRKQYDLTERNLELFNKMATKSHETTRQRDDDGNPIVISKRVLDWVRERQADLRLHRTPLRVPSARPVSSTFTDRDDVTSVECVSNPRSGGVVRLKPQDFAAVGKDRERRSERRSHRDRDRHRHRHSEHHRRSSDKHEKQDHSKTKLVADH